MSIAKLQNSSPSADPYQEEHLLMRNLKLATKACHQTFIDLDLGSSNRSSPVFGEEKKVSNRDLLTLRTNVDLALVREKSDISLARYCEINAIFAKSHRMGNCGEASATAFHYLIKEPDCPQLDLVGTLHVNHSFVIVGEGDTAVACDPWARIVYPMKDLNVHLKKIIEDNNLGSSDDLSLINNLHTTHISNVITAQQVALLAFFCSISTSITASTL